MAGVGQSPVIYPAVTCKHQLLLPTRLLMLSLFVFLPFMECMYATNFNSVQPLNGLRIHLAHKDSLLFPHMTSAERLKRAVQRSQARFEELQLMSAVNAHKLQRGDETKDIEAPVRAGNGEFLMSLSIGTPPLPYSAIMDTGSDLIWTQCKPCTDCYNQPTPIYDPSSSSTYSKVLCSDSQCNSFACSNAAECIYNYRYGGGSFTNGILSYETFTLSSQQVSHIAFGCGHNNSGVGLDQGSGIVGFGRGPLSLNSQLGTSMGNKFSYCLVSLNDSPSKTSTLFLGNNATLNAANVSSTPIIQSTLNPTFYYLSLEGISVGGQSLTIPSGTFDLQSDGSGGFIIDSGTTVTLLKHNAYDLVKEALNSSINLPHADGSRVGLDLCFQQGSSNASFPSMTFHFKGADFDLSKDNYLSDIGSGVLCLTMVSNGAANSLNIFGNLQQQNYQILYDNGRNILSFAPAVCGSVSN